MKNFPQLIVALLISVVALAQQKVCETPEESIEDLNSISAKKCALEDKDNDVSKKQTSIKVSTKRRRVVREKNKVATAIGSINSNSKIANLKNNTALIKKLELESKPELIERLPFNLVEEVPLFEKCSDVPILKRSKCFIEEVSNHISRNLKYPKDAYKKGIQGRVLVQFTINQLGNVEDIRMRGPVGGKLLEKEARRIIENLPKFIPGKHNGKTVKVKYGVPVTFKIPKTKK